MTITGKPHVFKAKGLWYCKMTVYGGHTLYGEPQRSPRAAYSHFRLQNYRQFSYADCYARITYVAH